MRSPDIHIPSNPAYVPELHLSLCEHGWSHALLLLRMETKAFRLTHIFNDPMDEIGRATCALAEGATEAWFRWFDEPCTYLFRLREVRLQKQLLTLSCWETPGKIISSDKLPEKDDMDWSVEIARTHWIGLVAGELGKISMLMRQPEYAEHRRAFPHEHAAVLRQWCDKHMRSKA
jgi:hypothetical protein